MRWRVAFLVSILGLLLLVWFVPALHAEAQQLLSYNACNTPLPYKIGSIDSRFGLSRTDVQQSIEQATSIWNTAEGKTLFTYSPTADLTVNFVYDQRQALNSQIQQLDSNLSEKNATLQQQVNAYKAREAAYEQKAAAFSALVNKYNNEGGAPPDVYPTLIQEQKDLKAEGQSLNDEAHQLNLSTHDYNAGVSALNQDINKLNNALSQKPEEGLYNGKDVTITIYLTNSHDELIHTLAHEFGHSLGMMHVDGETSIMYPYTSKSLTVSANDMQQLSYVCRQQSLIMHEAVVADVWLFTQVQHLQSYLQKK